MIQWGSCRIFPFRSCTFLFGTVSPWNNLQWKTSLSSVSFHMISFSSIYREHGMVPGKFELFSELSLTNEGSVVYFFLMRFKWRKEDEAAVQSLKKILKKIEIGLDKSKKSAKLHLTFSLDFDEWSWKRCSGKNLKNLQKTIWQIKIWCYVSPHALKTGELVLKLWWKKFEKSSKNDLTNEKNDAKLWLRCASWWKHNEW